MSSGNPRKDPESDNRKSEQLRQFRPSFEYGYFIRRFPLLMNTLGAWLALNALVPMGILVLMLLDLPEVYMAALSRYYLFFNTWVPGLLLVSLGVDLLRKPKAEEPRLRVFFEKRFYWLAAVLTLYGLLYTLYFRLTHPEYFP